MPGESGPTKLSRALSMVISGFFAIACYLVIEITILIFWTFKRYRGLYFWSMLVATWSIMLHNISAFLRFFALAPSLPMCFLIVLGWYGMVTGQAVVLYSRLHLVVFNPRITRTVLYMIIFNFLTLHVPVTILFLGNNAGVEEFLAPFNVYERIQLTGFCVQETIISAIYMWEAVKLSKDVIIVNDRPSKGILVHLLLVNTLVVVLDGTLLYTEYSNNFEIQTTYKPVVYGLKLRMEFSVLNRLVNLVLVQRSLHEGDSGVSHLELQSQDSCRPQNQS
ncbi:hypothetical protein DPV78_011695 [Talaromyces pinophilus]|nr:hypothetical protein DPV78_011695 [Talaromyces pinophilus]